MLHKHLTLNLIVLSPIWAYLIRLVDWLRDSWQHFDSWQHVSYLLYHCIKQKLCSPHLLFFITNFRYFIRRQRWPQG